MDGNELVNEMRDWERANQKSRETNYMNAAGYSRYVMGVHDALDSSQRICHENVTVGQVSAVVAKFLTANPERWSEPAFLLVEEALTKAFPCRTQ